MALDPKESMISRKDIEVAVAALVSLTDDHHDEEIRLRAAELLLILAYGDELSG